MSTDLERLRTDLFVLAIARNIRNGDIVHVGASQKEVWRATEIAKMLWAPEVRVVAAGTYLLRRGPSSAEMMETRTYGRDVIAGRDATLMQTHVFDGLHRSRVSFPGAIEVDRHGNGNLIGARIGEKWARGPGSAGLSTLTSFAQRFCFCLKRHTPQTLVEKVAAISVLGNPTERERQGYRPDALSAVITPLCTFAPGADGLRLVECAPGVDLAQLQQKTGFDIAKHRPFAERALPSEDERKAMAATLSERERQE